jgi:hypothetical protein
MLPPTDAVCGFRNLSRGLKHPKVPEKRIENSVQMENEDCVCKISKAAEQIIKIQVNRKWHKYFFPGGV